MMELPLFLPPIEPRPVPHLKKGEGLQDAGRLLVKLKFEECSDYEVAYPWCFEMEQVKAGTLRPEDAEWHWCYTQAFRDIPIDDSQVMGWYPLPAPNYNEGLGPTEIPDDPEPEEPGPQAA